MRNTQGRKKLKKAEQDLGSTKPMAPAALEQDAEVVQGLRKNVGAKGGVNGGKKRKRQGHSEGKLLQDTDAEKREGSERQVEPSVGSIKRRKKMTGGGDVILNGVHVVADLEGSQASLASRPPAETELVASSIDAAKQRKNKKRKERRKIQKEKRIGEGGSVAVSDTRENDRGDKDGASVGGRKMGVGTEVAEELAGANGGGAGHKHPHGAGRQQSSLLDKMRARLQGGHFRMLNERLYTSRGADAFASFQKDPDQFQHYHRGYQEQMAHWPKLPVEVVGDWLRARGPKLKVADFGCGDARLAASVKNRVFSLDLVAARPGVIACNMAHTPLESSSVDVAVFCLSLMGTDYGSFLEEAHRVLVSGGWLLIAEVKSRFDPRNGGADPRAFVGALKKFGFALENQDDSNKMFMWWEFRKGGEERQGKKGGAVVWPALKACIYKRR